VIERSAAVRLRLQDSRSKRSGHSLYRRGNFLTMELRHLRYFIEAAETQHFGRAAERLHVSRPAISQIVANLEDEIGTALFERLTHRVKLTAAGRALLPRLQAIVAELDRALLQTKRLGEGRTGALSIGYGSLTLHHRVFRAAIKRFRDTWPEVALSLSDIPTLEQERALVEGKIDAGFMHFGPKSASASLKRGPDALQREELQRLVIQTCTLAVAVAADHPIARKKSVSFAELAGERFVVVARSSVIPTHGALFALCQKAGFAPNIVQEVDSVAVQLNLVSVGMGIGLTVIGKDLTYPPTLAVVPLADVKYTTTFALCWAKGRIGTVLPHFTRIVKDLTADQ
jgi:DNA-binding transcriptional LysR family regulator